MEPAIIVQGGCMTPQSPRREACLKEAVTAGMKLMKSGRSSLDAVEAAVTILEDCPEFNAGVGSSLRCDSTVRMDALIMEGQDLKAGSVSALRRVKNPVKVARLVMEKTEHIQLCGEGASEFAQSMGVPQISEDELKTPVQVKRLADVMADVQKERGCDTVGAVAIDLRGLISCATSTGGTMGSLPGRVGDSCQIGAGGYADNLVGGVSTTGLGEAISRVVLARLILFHMEQGTWALSVDRVFSANDYSVKKGNSIQVSLDKALAHMEEKTGSSCAGAIVINSKGEIGKAFLTDQMPWASMHGDQLCWGFHHGNEYIEKTDV